MLRATFARSRCCGCPGRASGVAVSRHLERPLAVAARAALIARLCELGQAWIDFAVYMPGCWPKDPQRQGSRSRPTGIGPRAGWAGVSGRCDQEAIAALVDVREDEFYLEIPRHCSTSL